MKKSIKVLSIFLIIAFTLFLTSSVVKAGTIASLNVEEGTSNIAVSGTTESSVSAVTITVYKADGVTIAALKNASVDDANKFSKTIDLPEGNYTVKVADYAGGAIVTKSDVVVGEKAKTEITSVELTLKAPVIGETVTTKEVNEGNMGYFDQDNKPEVTAEDGANYEVGETMWISGTYKEIGEDFEKPISTTFEKDKYYYAGIQINAKDGFKFANGLKIKVNGEEPAEVFGIFDNGGNTILIAKIKATEKAEEKSAEETTDVEETKAVENNEKTPQTGDTIRNVFIVLAVAMGALALTFVFRKRKISKH